MGRRQALLIYKVLFLRISTLLSLAASVVLMAIDVFNNDGWDLIAYRYSIATGAVGFMYSLIQIPFAIYDAVQGKSSMCHTFDFFADQVVAFLLASGVGVGYGVLLELRRFLKTEYLEDKFERLGAVGVGRSRLETINKTLSQGTISTRLLLVGFASMAMLSILSSSTHPLLLPKQLRI